MSKLLFLKTTKGLITILVVSLLIGFFAGMQYKMYQIQKNLEKFQESISDIFNPAKDENTKTQQTNDGLDFASQETEILSKEKKQKAIEQIDINVKVEEYKSWLDSENRFNGKARNLKGTIKNTSDKNFADVELLVVFLDENNQPIYENNYNPLYNSDKMESIMLKPNYSNEFGFNTDGVPSEWSGEIEYRISDISY